MTGVRKSSAVAAKKKAVSAKGAGAAKGKAGDSSNLVIGPRKPTGPGKDLGAALLAVAKTGGKKAASVAQNLTATVKAKASTKGDDNTNLVIGPRKPVGPRKDLVEAVKGKVKSAIGKVGRKLPAA
ncbi:hypothetical protein [Panacagrimonas sp.]|uniref:hypothetical protein n=1 Tax=Panacagrimonas sp. TaxID=2480088 RepID=UPI003B51B6BB